MSVNYRNYNPFAESDTEESTDGFFLFSSFGYYENPPKFYRHQRAENSSEEESIDSNQAPPLPPNHPNSFGASHYLPWEKFFQVYDTSTGTYKSNIVVHQFTQLSDDEKQQADRLATSLIGKVRTLDDPFARSFVLRQPHGNARSAGSNYWQADTDFIRPYLQPAGHVFLRHSGQVQLPPVNAPTNELELIQVLHQVVDYFYRKSYLLYAPGPEQLPAVTEYLNEHEQILAWGARRYPRTTPREITRPQRDPDRFIHDTYTQPLQAVWYPSVIAPFPQSPEVGREINESEDSDDHDSTARPNKRVRTE